MYNIDGLKTKRLEFRKLTKDDIPLWYEFFQDPNSLLYIGANFTDNDMKVSENWIDRQVTRYDENGSGLYAFIDRETKLFIGQCGLIPRDIDGQDEVEIAYHVLTKYRRKGYGSEAAIAVKDFAKRNKLKDSLISIIHVDNEASQKVAMKNGMKRGVKTRFMEMDVFIYRVKL